MVLGLASLAVLNGRIWTGDRRRPWAEALAVNGGRISVVGSNDELKELARSARRLIDARGGLVVPGFIDSHVHFLAGGFRLRSVQLRSARTPEEFTARIAEYAAQAPAGSWITGGDWDHENWGGELPRREWIDGVSRGHPVWVTRLDGHMGLANSLALQAAGVSAATTEVEGGQIVRDASGRPTGILKDKAMELIARVIPEPGPAAEDAALGAAMRYVAERGVTSIHHMGSWEELAVFERAHEAGRLRVRIYAAVPLQTWERLRERVAGRGRGDEWLRTGGLKGFVDGSLGARTAAFLEPYSDAPEQSGLLVHSPEELYQWIRSADAAGLQLLVHAIGDRANRLLLDIYERVGKENGPRDRRFRVEHAQHLSAADIARFGALGVIASMQPYHCIDDGRWAERAIGKGRAAGAYAFRSLLRAGAVVAFGSDWFVAPPSPLEGIYAAVTRRTLDGANPEGWVPAERIGVEEALRAYTAAGAYASFEEDLKGRLVTGKLADFVVLGADITGIRPEEIRQVPVRMTVVGGMITHEDGNL